MTKIYLLMAYPCSRLILKINSLNCQKIERKGQSNKFRKRVSIPKDFRDHRLRALSLHYRPVTIIVLPTTNISRGPAVRNGVHKV